MRQHSVNLSQPFIGPVVGSKTYSLPFKGLVCQSFYRTIYGFAYMRYFVYKGVIKSQMSLIR